MMFSWMLILGFSAVRGRGGVPPRACDRGVRKPGNWQTANGRGNMRGNLK